MKTPTRRGCDARRTPCARARPAWWGWTASASAASHATRSPPSPARRPWWRTCSWPAWPRSSSAADPVTRGARFLLLGPYVLLLVAFFVLPLLLMLAISFSRQSYGQLEWAFTPQHYVHFFTDAYYLG